MPSPLRLIGWIWPPGPASARPVLENGQEVRAYLRAVDEDGGPATPTGLSFELRRPDGSVQVLEGGAIQAGEREGEVFAAFQADQNGLWRWQWIGTGPTEARDGGAFRVQSSSVQPPGPGNPVLTTEDLDPLATEGGGVLRVKRIPALPRASSSSGLVVVGAQAGQARHFPAEQLSGPHLVVDGGRGVGPGQRPTVNDASVIAEAGQEVYSRWGGGHVLTWRSHRIDSPVRLPPGVDIGYVTPPGGPRVLRPSGELRLTDVPALYVSANGYIALQQSARNLCLVRDGLPEPATYPSTYPWSADAMEAALDRQGAFDGIPLRILGDTPDTVRDDLEIANVSGFGFDTLIRAEIGARLSISNIRGDNRNLIYLQNSGGEPRISDVYSRSYLGSGGTTAIACPILAATNAGGLLSITIAPPREPPSTKPWQANTYYLAGTKIYWASNLYRVRSAGTTGSTPPTHTAGARANGEATLTWQRAWTGVNLAPATAIPKTTGGFLKPGHSIILQVPPYDCYSGNPAYPHWSTPGAPADVVDRGGDLLDPMMRGRYTVQALGAADADTATIILDCPYDPGLAAATANRYLLIMPGVRFGTMLSTDDVDACQIRGLTSKAQRFHLWANGATHTVISDQFEDPATGEADVGDWGGIGYLVDKGATRFEVIGTAAKTKGILYYMNGNGRNVIRLKGLAREPGLYAVFHRGGAVDADLLFEGPSVVYSHSAANHMALRWSGTKPAIAGNTDPTDRVSLDGYVPSPTNKKQARAMVGANGFRMGVGLSANRYVPGATYTPNAIVYNDLPAEDGSWLYRNDAAASGAAGAGDGPQHTSGTVADGACSWTSIGAYSGGVDTIQVDKAGEVSIWDAATGAMAPRQKVARFPRGAPELYGEVWQVTPDAAETKTPVVSRRGDIRLRRRTLSQIQTTDADAAGTGRTRLAIATDASGGEALAHAFENEAPSIYATQSWVRGRGYAVNVRDFGAKGDKTTDDRAAFLAARDAIPAGQPGEVRVPLGGYYLGSSMTSDNGNQVRWVFEDGAFPTNAQGGAVSFARLSGSTYRRQYRSSRTPRRDIADVIDTAQGNALVEYLTATNNGPASGYGTRFGYVSHGYGQGGFDIAEGIIARWERPLGAGQAGSQFTQWLVATSPAVPSGDNNNYQTAIAEWNIVNRGPDRNFPIKRRSLYAQRTGFLQIVPEDTDLVGAGVPYGIGHVDFGIVYTWGQGGDGGRGYVPRTMVHVLGEPNSVHDAGYAVYYSGSDGTDTLPGGGPSNAYLGLAEGWKWGLKLNEAAFAREALGLGAGHRIGWLDASDVLLAELRGTAEGGLALGAGQATRGVTALALAFGRAAVDGDRQRRVIHLRRNSGANPTNLRLTTDGSTAGAGNQVVLANSSAARIRANVVARSGSPASAGWSVTALVRRGASASALTIVSSTVTKDTSDAAAADWALALVADTSIGGVGLEITGTGTIAIFADVEIAELVG